MKIMGFDVDDFRPECGFEFKFVGGKKEREYVHLCRVTDVIAGRKLAYTWRYEGCPGDSLVIFELYPMGAQTLLKLTHEGLETIAVNGPDFAVKNFEAGWNEIIGRILKDHVEQE